jgi:hypothetical protein
MIKTLLAGGLFLLGTTGQATAQTNYFARTILTGVKAASPTAPPVSTSKSTCETPIKGKWVLGAVLSPEGTVSGTTAADALEKAGRYCEGYAATSCEATYLSGTSPLVLKVHARKGVASNASPSGQIYHASNCVPN